jgi:ketosteroid isomerase-like protein
MTILDQIVEMEKVLLHAMLKSDIKVLDFIIADDLIFTDHTSHVMDKASDLEAHRTGSVKIEALEPSERIIKTYGNTAIVSVLMKIRGKYMDQSFQGSNRYTRVWVNINNSWKIVAGHSTLVNS